ncbi:MULTISPECIES: ATP-dependent DNA helicase DinG [unclassified Paenibacillus]|uniref:ATP-dependent DNA helicase DinG n=1 Tax=unclassified Paenibacillus TaxID=185978 RepID=UPI00240741CC|nr:MULTISPECIES: ATP-dependent DNA helicase DinG [unclassified Paenibacillus]MDF9840282.1 ATP-dependent DNA helicase DinG [Paenibacillus sp. PastF-2]MDF9846864.1 ATP-dependent DNA helicase DinG [Paenibacillus sp. PastM-2]MDF9853436.1 ATP-dependent DNA helicase DinG [Paenibacillus sp. PastF-1]MDH6479077.1 ATP-dependent DNA helicase DinG [Paenibacillus sp. PastH-2]MDH6506809.1 ATP-dependent DNA helicase DinG [Paenibacillus sp. PastM-3]
MKFAVLDFETTGTQSVGEIIQVGLAIIEEDRSVSRVYGSYVKPGTSIPPFITGLTGITDADVADAPELDEMMMELVPLLDDVVLVGHNVAFDFHFLQNALDRCGYLPFQGRILDTIDFLKICFPSLTTYQLGAVSAHFKLTHERPHQADSDALATALVLLKCLDELYSLPLLTIQRLNELFAGEDSDLAWYFDGLLHEREMETFQPEGELTFHRQLALAVGDWNELVSPREEGSGNPLENVSFEDYMAEVTARLKDTLPQYETRESQEIMIGEVKTAFQEEKHLLIEAGTGTGKSLGYLLPAIYHSVRTDQKVMVSTHTINLQDQLRERDIPLLTTVVPFPFKAAVFKGRGHYLCLRKFEHKINNKDFVSTREETLTAAQMLVWLTQTQSGDDEELNLSGRGGDFWESVASDTDSCLGRSCPWFRKCYYHRAKHEAGIADVVITNHSKLFADVKAGHQLLPAYEHLVIDEAHHLEDVAGKHLGMQMKYFTVAHTLTRLYKDSKSGQLPALRQTLQSSGSEQASEWSSVIDRIYPDLLTVKETWDVLSDKLFGLLPDRSDAAAGEAGQLVSRLHPGKKPRDWEELAALENTLNLSLSDIIRRGDKMLSEMRDTDSQSSSDSLVTDIGGLFKDLASIREQIRFFMGLNDENVVYWMEGSSNYRGKSLQLYAVPVDVSAQLKELFFDKKKSITLTSATLSVDKSFQFMIDNLGLGEAAEQERLMTALLPSPFNYREQALLVIPRDFPSVKGSVGDARFVDKLVHSLAEAAVATKGRMLVLFTSYKMLRQVYDPLKEALATEDIAVLGQGVEGGSRSKLIRRFQDSSAAVLLGTSSFWEGVDIPGDALTCLAIVRLPFQPPNHPLAEAKAELLQAQKKNPFMKLSVPQAVIRFKQGFGRLVRTAQDRGIVIVYDTRVIESYYGKYFLYSLPGPKMEHMLTEQMVPRIEEWLEGGIS